MHDLMSAIEKHFYLNNCGRISFSKACTIWQYLTWGNIFSFFFKSPINL